MAALAVAGLLTGLVFTAASSADDLDRGAADRVASHKWRRVGFSTVAAGLGPVGAPICLDPATTAQSCLQTTNIGNYTLTGDLTASGVGTAVGMTAQGVRRTQAMIRLGVTAGPCGAGTVTLETFISLRLLPPPALPEPIVSGWRLVPEQGTGGWAGAEGQGQTPTIGFGPGGSILADFTGKVRCH